VPVPVQPTSPPAEAPAAKDVPVFASAPSIVAPQPLRLPALPPAPYDAPQVRAGINDLRVVMTTGLGNSAELGHDVASLAEINAMHSDDLVLVPGQRLGAVGLIGRDVNLMQQNVQHGSDAVFVTRAVRHEPIAMDPAVYVQTAVRLSQAEAQTREMVAVSHHRAAVGITRQFDAFVLQAPNAPEAQQGAADAKTSAAPDGKPVSSPAQMAQMAQDGHDGNSGHGAHDAHGGPRSSTQVKSHRPTAAPGFAAQLQQSANDFRARLPVAAASAERQSSIQASRLSALPSALPSDAAAPDTRVAVAAR
jgi:hypothetical protein